MPDYIKKSIEITMDKQVDAAVTTHQQGNRYMLQKLILLSIRFWRSADPLTNVRDKRVKEFFLKT